jgi:RimJ/RimL family protein N-acetyltransferase
MLADPEVARFLADGQPRDRVEAWRQLAMIIGHWELRGFGLWAVEERATGQFIGRIGCHEPEGWPGFELGYALAREAWGRGYAREGAAAALAFARRELARDTIISLIRPANRASIAVAEHFGARRTGSVEFFGAPTEVYTYPVSA